MRLRSVILALNKAPGRRPHVEQDVYNGVRRCRVSLVARGKH